MDVRNILWFFGLVIVGLLAYLALWPVAVRPAAWEAPENAGYTGDFAANDQCGQRRDDVSLEAEGVQIERFVQICV